MENESELMCEDTWLPEDPLERELAASHYMKARGVEAVDYLLSKGMTAGIIFYLAAEVGLVEVMDVLVNKYGVDIDAWVPRDGYSTTPLIGASEGGVVGAVEWLLDQGAELEKLSKNHNNGDCTALWAACEKGFLRVVRLLLDRGANVDTYKQDTGNTALWIAVRHGHDLVCTELLRCGAQIELSRGRNPAPLVTAVCNGRLSTLALLRSAGANVPVRRCYDTIVAMEVTGTTQMGQNSRKLSPREIDTLKQLVSVEGLEQLLMLAPESYSSAQAYERTGQFREALKQISAAVNSLQETIGPYDSQNAAWTQLRMDEERLMNAVFGVAGSDGRLSAWNRHTFCETDAQPSPLVYYSWARHGDVIYRYGGLSVPDNEVWPSRDELWAFQISTKTWRLVPTFGASPGPRSGHISAIYNGFMYVFGGRGVDDMDDITLHRLDLVSFRWQVVKTKGPKPSPRECLAAFVYKDKLYIHGGIAAPYVYLNDLWCYSFERRKWKLVSEGGTRRGDHGIWIANDKVYILGGENLNPKLVSTIQKEVQTIVAFETFDMESRQWKSMRCVGDDPWDLMEYTMLPIYHGQDEPSSIIVWGGYRHVDKRLCDPKMQAELVAEYGDEARQLGSPYRRRLLRFDLGTNTWTVLKLLSDVDVTPTAQSFAAELSTADGITRLVVGGGYGFTIASKPRKVLDRHLASQLQECIVETGGKPEDCLQPDYNQEVFEVEVLDERTACFADRAANGIGWEWELSDMPLSSTPSLHIEPYLGSPTLHLVIDNREIDFEDPPRGAVPENAEDNVLGRRVILKNLQSRSDLNGSIGRVGRWVAKSQRYQVFVPESEKCGPFAGTVKAYNMSYAPPLSDASLRTKSRKMTMAYPSPVIMVSWIKSSADSKSPMDSVLGRNQQHGEDDDKAGNAMPTDTYRGPLSGRAFSVVHDMTTAQRAPRNGNSLVFVYMPASLRKSWSTDTRTKEQREINEQCSRYEEFVSELKREDKPRIKSYESRIRSARNKKEWDKWLSIQVAIDGLVPSVERTLIVTPNITLSRLHHQVLVPAIGWTPNFHSYAFRRRLEPRGHMSECWIGPRVSTSLDSFFQPLYIGGAMANDRKILLGDLFDSNDGEPSTVQYVHDYGDWWSHTITISKVVCDPPRGTTVAHLESGSGCCPPEDIGGLVEYCNKMEKLGGGRIMTPGDAGEKPEEYNFLGDGEYMDASKSLWWKMWNTSLRAKSNNASLRNPLEFDIETHRRALETSLRRVVISGTEHEQLSTRQFTSGISQTGPNGRQRTKQAMPTDFCATCGVTATLKLCSGCKSVAFCCREHQVEYWPKHKAACLAAQKKGKKEK